MNDKKSVANFYLTNRFVLNYLTFTVLFFFLLFKGIIPAFKNICSDFPNYYTASRLAIEKKQIDFYNDSSFNTQINNYGIDVKGKFSPFPPPTIFIMMPLYKFSPVSAKRIFTVINLLLLFPSAWFISKASGIYFIEGLNLVLLSGINLANNFLLGQVYLFLLATMFLSYNFFKQKKYIPAGILTGIFAAIKYFPVLFLFPFSYTDSRKPILAFTFSFLFISAAVIPFIGIEVYYSFLKIPFQHLNGALSGQSAFSEKFQSWNAFFRNIFIYDKNLNPFPLLNSAFLFNLFRIIVPAILISAGVVVYRKTKNILSKIELLFCIPCLMALSVLPASATYHYILLLFPLAFLIQWLTAFKMYNKMIILLLMFAVIGFVPSALDFIYQAKQPYFIFKFHRLFLVTAFYVYALSVLNKISLMHTHD